MLTKAISPTVIRENRWEVFTTALMGKGFMPSNHCFHYNYICTLIKRAHHNANNTPDVLYIIYIKANQCSYCVQSAVHVPHIRVFLSFLVTSCAIIHWSFFIYKTQWWLCGFYWILWKTLLFKSYLRYFLSERHFCSYPLKYSYCNSGFSCSNAVPSGGYGFFSGRELHACAVWWGRQSVTNCDPPSPPYT